MPQQSSSVLKVEQERGLLLTSKLCAVWEEAVHLWKLSWWPLQNRQQESS